MATLLDTAALEEIAFEPDAPEFVAHAVELLGVHGSDEDGFELLFSEAVAGFEESRPDVEGIDAELIETAAPAEELGQDVEGQLALGITPAEIAADAELADYEGALPTTAGASDQTTISVCSTVDQITSGAPCIPPITGDVEGSECPPGTMRNPETGQCEQPLIT